MNELDELKKRLEEIVTLFKRVVKTRAGATLERLRPGEGRRIDPKAWGMLFIVCLIFGFLIGFTAKKIDIHLVSKVASKPSFKKFSLMHYIFGKTVPFPGPQPDGSFVFANFEKPSDLQAWKLIKSELDTTNEILLEGSSSGKVTFYGGGEYTAISIEDLIRSRKGGSDWGAFESLSFRLYNPSSEGVTLSILITDLWGQKFHEDLAVAPWSKDVYNIPISQIAGSINHHKVDQVSFLRSAVREDAVIYLDDVRLIPSPVGATGVATATAQGPFDYGFSKRKPFWTVMDPELGGEVVRIPFIVKNETQGFCKLCPVEGGIPLPMGEVRESSRIRLRNAQGEDLPFQTRVLTRWPDGSLKWLGLHFQGTLAPGDGVGFFLEYGPTVQTIDFEGRLSVVEDASLIKINTGALEASFEKDKFYLFERVVLDLNSDGVFEPSEEMLKEASLTLQFRGKEFRTDLAKKDYKIEVEEKGTQRVVVKASGWFQSEDGQRYCQAIVRYYFYQGKSYVKVSHTLIYTGYPENKQFDEYKNLKLPENETIDSFGLRLPYPFSENKEDMVVAGQDQAIPTGVQLSDRVRLLQMDWDRGTLTRDSILVPSKSFYAGWLDVSNRSKGITLAIRNFRENFPKAFEADRSKGEIRVDLWPKDAGELDLSTTEKAVGPDDYGRGNAFGLAKTHDLLFYFHGPVKREIPNPGDIAASFMKSMIIRPNPYWIDATGALGRLHPVEQRYATEEKMLERLFDWATRHPRMFRWYGMLNFGDTLTWWREKDEERGYGTFGWHPVGRWGWYNCEGVGLHTGALLQFARSGEWRYFEFGESAARHIMDVDTVHYNTIENDKRLRKILKDKYSKVGAMHRHSADHWSGRTDEASHTNVVGILLYYFLTGDERALDVAKEIGEYFLSEPFTYIGYPHVAPNRAMANALWGDVLLYQVTGDERYKEAADKIVKIFLKGQQQDGSFLENYNPIFHIWSGEKHELYMAGYLVGALISYHELTQDEEVKEMFLRLVRYLAPLPYSGPTILHGLAYAYLTTHDPFFIEVSERNLKGLLDHQQFSQDPIMDGLIYEKPIYHRPMAFLSTVPYVFGAFDEEMLKKGSRG